MSRQPADITSSLTPRAADLRVAARGQASQELQIADCQLQIASLKSQNAEVRLLIATTNTNKVREIGALLDGAGVDLVTLDAWREIAAPEETGRTFEENAREKAAYYAAATGELTVAEDSGLEIDALDGAPGVESARYGGADLPYPEKFARLYDALRAKGRVNSPARFVCALALMRDRQLLFETTGTIEGTIAPEPRGAGGFGYDPIFFYPPYARTLGEVSQQEKAAVSHRGQAFRKLRAFLERKDR